MKNEKNLIGLYSVCNLALSGFDVPVICAALNLPENKVLSILSFLPIYKEYKKALRKNRHNGVYTEEVEALYNRLLMVCA